LIPSSLVPVTHSPSPIEAASFVALGPNADTTIGGVGSGAS
jgi:hypothetical protein